jgi:A/G-specific adenine glycosylase
MSPNPKIKRLVPLLLNWFSTNARDLPWRRTRDLYAIWVSEIMLQQTQVKTVIPFWNRWMRELPTIESVANASPAKIHKLWEGLGYYTRARNLQKAAQVIMEKHNGGFPSQFEDVLALPGIGRYTAGAICSIAFNQRAPILDGNVIRVLTRIFGIAGNPREKPTNKLLWQLAEDLVRNTEQRSHLNQSLMELGALICTPRNAQCGICPAQKLCVAYKENRANELPNLGTRKKVTARRFVAFVIEREGKFLVRQRPDGIVNAHLWEFPNIEVNGANIQPTKLFRKEFLVAPQMIQPLHTVKHSITRYRITLDAFAVRLKNNPAQNGVVWKTPTQMRQLAFTAAHKKLASAAAKSILSGR